MCCFVGDLKSECFYSVIEVYAFNQIYGMVVFEAWIVVSVFLFLLWLMVFRISRIYNGELNLSVIVWWSNLCFFVCVCLSVIGQKGKMQM